MQLFKKFRSFSLNNKFEKKRNVTVADKSEKKKMTKDGKIGIH